MLPVQMGIYRHFKGNYYRVLYTARHSETTELFVVYQALYGEKGVWIRPLAMWQEQVLVDGRETPRFRYIGEQVPPEENYDTYALEDDK